MDALERIKKQVTDNPIIVYMKGTPDFPQCGFSARVVQALKACETPFAYINIFEDEEVYRALPKFANRSEEHTSELQSLMRISYDVFCLKKKKKKETIITNHNKTEKKTKTQYNIT